MKKLIGTVAVAALLATAAFAEIGIGGWGRGLWTVFGYDGGVEMTHGISWGGNLPRVGITVHGDSENVGFVFDLIADGGTVKGNDLANIWAKPWDWLKLSVGRIQDDTLRVNADFGQFQWLRAGAGGLGEDITFRRIGWYGGFASGGSMEGAEIALTPIDGLYIAAGFKMDQATEFVDVLKLSQYAVGYKIEDLIAIKAQYIGGGSNGSLDDYYGTINAAVDLLMIENNFISIGAFIPTDFDQDIVVSAVYSGGFNALSLNALVAASINDDFGLNIGVGVGYDLGNGLAIDGDVRAELVFPKEGDARGSITVGAFFAKGFSNGKFGIGAEVAIPFGEVWSKEDGKYVNNEVGFTTLEGSDKVSVAIPVRFEYFF